MVAINLTAREKFHHPQSSDGLLSSLATSLVVSVDTIDRFNSLRSKTSPNADALKILVSDSDPNICIINYVCILKNLLLFQIVN